MDKEVLVKKRAVLKRKITLLLAKTSIGTGILSDKTIESSLVDQIETIIVEIEALDNKICEIMIEGDDDETISEDLDLELNRQTEYHADLKGKLALLKSGLQPDSDKGASNFDLKLPLLECGNFTGEGGQSLEYNTFIGQFNNIVGLRNNISDATKMTYLRSYLRGYTFTAIPHLQESNSNYAVALNLLEKEFLNVNAIVDDLFAKLLSLKPKFDVNFLQTKLYINDIRCVLSDLEQYKINLTANSSSEKLVSHIVMRNLPSNFRQELVRKVGSSYPSLGEIYDNYVDVIRTICIQSASTPGKEKTFNNTLTVTSSSGNNYSNCEAKSSNTKFQKFCMLCNFSGHNMMSCRKYGDHNSRIKRCKDLKLCHFCTSNRHMGDKCHKKLDFSCTICESKEHISALCAKFKPARSIINCNIDKSCQEKSYLLPTYTVILRFGDLSTPARCLVDSGSMRSYFSESVANKLGIPLQDNKVSTKVCTYAAEYEREMCEVSLGIWSGEKAVNLPVFIDPDFNL